MRRNSIKFISIALIILIFILVLVACGNVEENLQDYKTSAIDEVSTARAERLDHLYSIDKINELNTILENAISQINVATEKSKIDLIVSQAKTSFSNVITMQQEEEQRQDAIKKEFANYKRQRQTELEEYRAMLEDRKYSSSNVTKLNDILAIAKDDIFFANTFEDVLKIYNDAVAALFEVPTIEQENEALLQSARANAVLALTNYRKTKNDDDYSKENCVALDRIVDSMTLQITSAVTTVEIENLLQRAFILLDAVEQLGQTELDRAKSRAIETLRLYRFNFDDSKFTSDGQLELNNILNDALDDIKTAEDEETVANIVERAKINFGAVKTYAELFEEYRLSAEQNITQHRASKPDDVYSNDGVRSLNLILQNAISSLKNTTTFEAVDAIVSETIRALDDVNVLETELVKIKESKIEELIAYRASFESAEYTQKSIEQLNNILESSKNNISNAITLADVNYEFELARLQMNAVLTIPQELAQKKAVAVQELNEYRLLFVDEDYSAFGVNELNTALSNGITAINQSADLVALEEAFNMSKNNLDNIMKYGEELRYRKDVAIEAIRNIRNSKNDAAYSSSGIEKLDQIVVLYSMNINEVTVIEDITALQLKAIQELNSIPIYSQQLKIEIAQRVVDIKEYHSEKLTQKYTDEGAVLLEMALRDSVNAIQNAKSLEQLDELFLKAKTSLDEIQTYEEELSDAKRIAENSLRLYRDTKLNSLYTQEGISLLDDILADVVDAIWDADNFASVTNVLEQGKAQLDEVPTHLQELESYRLILIEDLEEYRSLKQNVNYSDEGKLRLDQALQAGIEDINKSQSIEQAQDAFNRAKINLDSVPNLNQGIQKIKENACDMLQSHRNSKDNSDYTSESAQMLDIVLNQGLQNINKASTEDEVMTVLNKAISALDDIKSISDVLNESKAEALSALRVYRESKIDSDYSNNGINQLNDILRDGEIAIDKATTIEEVNVELQNAKNALDLVPTEEDENNFDIWEIRNNALEEINAFRDGLGLDNYGPKGKEQLDDIIIDSMSGISTASTPNEVEQIVQESKIKLQAVLTYKYEYRNEIYIYRDSFEDTDYTSDGLESLDAITQEYAALIIDCSNSESALQVYAEAIQSMDTILQNDGDCRFRIKSNAIDEITAYREIKSCDEYDDDGNDTLDRILSVTIGQIEKSTNKQQIGELLSGAKTRMDNVLSSGQKQAISWINQYRESFDDNNYTDEDIDALDEIVEVFISNLKSHKSLQNAMIEAAKAMDSIPTVSGDSRQLIKDTYINELINYKDTFVLSDYSPNGIALLESLMLHYISEIQLSIEVDINAFESILVNAKEAMDNTPTLKDEAIAELQAYRATFDDSEYSSEAIAKLDKILQEFIDMELKVDQIQSAVANAKEAMDSIPTLKDEAIAELQAYRATFDDSEYSSEAIEELDKILQEFIDMELEVSQIQSVVIETKAAMDSVPKLTISKER